MHGLNVRYDIAFGSGVNYGVDTGQPMMAANYFGCASSVTTLNDMLFFGEGTASLKEFYIKRMYNIDYFVNTLSTPCIFEVTKVRARSDVPNATDLNAAMIYAFNRDLPTFSGSAPDNSWIRQAWLSPVASPYLKKNFKIIYSKQYTMKPGKLYKVKDNVNRSLLNRALTRSAEGNTNKTIASKGSHIYLFRFYGTPALDNQASSPTNLNYTTLTPVRVVHMYKRYCSYYTMDDSDDTISVVGSLPQNRYNAFTNAYPTMYLQHKMDHVGGREGHSLVALDANANSAYFRGTNGAPIHVQ